MKDLRQRTYDYSVMVVDFVNKLDKRDLSAQIIAKQLLRSGTSVGANIAEAQAGTTKKDFTNFYSYALKSANESKF